MHASNFAQEAYSVHAHRSWTLKLSKRTNKNIQPFLELVQRLYNWLLVWPATKLVMSLRYSILPGFGNVTFTVNALKCSEGLWDFYVWLSQTSSLWSLFCTENGCTYCEQVWCRESGDNCHVYKSTLWSTIITLWITVIFSCCVLLGILYLMTIQH